MQFEDIDDKKYTFEDIRFTVNGAYLYATCLNMEGKDELLIRSLAESDASIKPVFHGIIRNIERLDGAPVLTYFRDEKGLYIKTQRVNYSGPTVFRILID